MESYFTLTQHSIDRACQRLGLAEKTAERKIKLAIQNGKCADNYTTSWERKFLKSQSRNGIALAYDNYCYIIAESGVCVTVYPLPGWWEKRKPYTGKELIKKPKKYFKKYYEDLQM